MSSQARSLMKMSGPQLNRQIKNTCLEIPRDDVITVRNAIDKWLIHSNIKADADEDSALAEKTRQKSIETLERYAREETLIKSDVLIKELGWSRQALSKARKAQRVYSVEVKGESYYPAFFIDSQYERRQLEAVSKILGNLPGTSKLQFMLTPKGSLNGLTPLKALAKGKIAEVKIAAKGFVER